MMIRPTLEQVFCNRDLFIAEYKTAGVEHAHEKITSLVKDLYEYFTLIFQTNEQERSINKFYRLLQKDHIEIEDIPYIKPRHRQKERQKLRLYKEIGKVKPIIFSFRSEILTKRRKLQKRLDKFPLLDCGPFEICSKKQLKAALLAETRRRNFKKRSRKTK